MSELVSLSDLRDKISSKINEYRDLIKEGNPEVMKEILDVMLLEREVLIDEFDYLRHNSQTYHSWSNGFSLRVDDLDDEGYNTLQLVANRLNRSPGSVLNVLMMSQLNSEEFMSSISAKELLSLYKEKVPKYSINHMKQLSVSKNDLIEIDGKINFNHINHLIVEEDVDRELFEKKINGIHHCGRVEIRSKSIPILILYAKIHHTDGILIP